MSNVVARFLEHLPSASNTEGQIIQYVLDHPDAAVEMSIYQLAQRAYVSVPSVSRFCKKLGFENYKDYQRRLSCELVLKKQLRPAATGAFEIRPDDPLELLVNDSFQRSLSALAESRALLDILTLKACADLMEKAGSVTFFGVGASQVVAEDAYLKFIRVNKLCQISPDQDAQQVLAKNMRPGDLGVIISYSGKTPAMVQVAEILRQNRVSSIAVTAAAPSPLQRCCTHSLCVSAAEVDIGGSKMVSRLAQLAVMDALYIAYFRKTYDKSAQALQSTRLDKQEGEA